MGWLTLTYMTVANLGGQPEVDAAFGRRIHQAMWDRRITQTMMAPALGLDQSTLSKKLRGVRPWSLVEAIRAADFLRMDVRDLLGTMWSPPSNPKTGTEGSADDDSPTVPKVSPVLTLMLGEGVESGPSLATLRIVA